MRVQQQAIGALSIAARPLFVTASIARPASSSRPVIASPPTSRFFSTTPSAFAGPPSSTPSSSDKPDPKLPIRDDAIAALSSYVRLVDPVTGSLAGPFPTTTILTKLDRSRFFLQQVAPAQPHRSTVAYDPSSSPSSIDVSALIQFPICKLIDKKEEFDRIRNLKRSSSATSSTTSSPNVKSPKSNAGSKEVQLTWSVSNNDLGHKLSKAKKEMLKGARINVVVTTKAGGRKYVKGLNPKEDQERESLLQQIEDYLCSAEVSVDEPQSPGPIARRLQEVDWQRGGSAAVMSFECFRK